MLLTSYCHETIHDSVISVGITCLPLSHHPHSLSHDFLALLWIQYFPNPVRARLVTCCPNGSTLLSRLNSFLPSLGGCHLPTCTVFSVLLTITPTYMNTIGLFIWAAYVPISYLLIRNVFFLFTWSGGSLEDPEAKMSLLKLDHCMDNKNHGVLFLISPPFVLPITYYVFSRLSIIK